MVNSGEGATANVARDAPPGLVRAGLVRNLAVGWALTGTPRYRDAARLVLQRLARELGPAADATVFADREAYVIGSVLEAAPAVGDSAVARRALSALDGLLRRAYARRRHGRRPLSPARRGDPRSLRGGAGRRRGARVELPPRRAARPGRALADRFRRETLLRSHSASSLWRTGRRAC